MGRKIRRREVPRAAGFSGFERGEEAKDGERCPKRQRRLMSRVLRATDLAHPRERLLVTVERPPTCEARGDAGSVSLLGWRPDVVAALLRHGRIRANEIAGPH